MATAAAPVETSSPLRAVDVLREWLASADDAMLEAALDGEALDVAIGLPPKWRAGLKRRQAAAACAALQLDPTRAAARDLYRALCRYRSSAAFIQDRRTGRPPPEREAHFRLLESNAWEVHGQGTIRDLLSRKS